MITLNFNSNPTNSLQTAKDLISNTVNQFIVRPLGNPNLEGVAGFIFDVLDDEEVSLESLVTDNYVEANYAVQDHVALKPIRFTLRGYVAELADQIPNEIAQLFIATRSLTNLGGLTPQFSIQAQQFYSKVNTVAQATQNVVNQAKSLYSLFAGVDTSASKQQKGFQFFYQLWQTRQLCRVETPFAVFDNMIIESLRALQAGQTRDISDFTVTFKMIRTTSTITLTGNLPNLEFQNAFGTSSDRPLLPSGRLQSMTSAQTQLGSDSGTSADNSKISSLFINQSQFPNTY